MAKLLIFGELKAYVSPQDVIVEMGQSVAEFRTQLMQQFPELQQKTFAIAVNQKIAKDEDPIPEHAEIALMPPFSGG